MSLGPFFANVLPDLEFAKPANDQRANDQRGKQRGKAGECRAEGDVAKDAERCNIMLQLDEQQPVEQSASVQQRSAVSIAVNSFASGLPRLQRLLKFHAARRF